jgi:hypothetical protein
LRSVYRGSRARVPQVTGRLRIPQIFTARVTYAPRDTPANTPAARTATEVFSGETSVEHALARSTTLHGQKYAKTMTKDGKRKGHAIILLHCSIVRDILQPRCETRTSESIQYTCARFTRGTRRREKDNVLQRAKKSVYGVPEKKRRKRKKRKRKKDDGCILYL